MSVAYLHLLPRFGGLLCLLLVSLGGCGGAPAPAAPLPPACPCEPSDEFSVDFVQIGGVSYGLDLKRELQYWKDSTHRSFPTGLDHTLCFGGSPLEDRTLLHIAGCRGARSVLRTFRSEAGSTEADVFVGEYELPTHVKLVALDQREDGVVFGLDEAGGQILRLQDDDGDGRPDRHDTYARAESHLLTEGHDLYATRSGRVIVMERGCVPDSEVFVVEDLDRDGRPEWSGETSYWYLEEGGPKSRQPIQASDTELRLIVGEGSLIEVWECDARGRPLASDPVKGILGRTDPDSEASDMAAMRRPLRVGMYLCAYDTQYKRWGVPQVVHACFPRVVDHAPRKIDASIANEINLAVEGLTDETRVVLVRGSQKTALPHGHIRDDIIRVRVPMLDASWLGRAQLQVLGPHTPEDALHPRITIAVPD